MAPKWDDANRPKNDLNKSSLNEKSVLVGVMCRVVDDYGGLY